jgi:hypothetical protein
MMDRTRRVVPVPLPLQMLLGLGAGLAIDAAPALAVSRP